MLVGPEIVHVGGVRMINCCEQVFVQPLSSVIVTVYSPAWLIMMHCVFVVYPPGPVHR
jgi:hypothetical protein